MLYSDRCERNHLKRFAGVNRCDSKWTATVHTTHHTALHYFCYQKAESPAILRERERERAQKCQRFYCLVISDAREAGIISSPLPLCNRMKMHFIFPDRVCEFAYGKNSFDPTLHIYVCFVLSQFFFYTRRIAIEEVGRWCAYTYIKNTIIISSLDVHCPRPFLCECVSCAVSRCCCHKTQSYYLYRLVIVIKANLTMGHHRRRRHHRTTHDGSDVSETAII